MIDAFSKAVSQLPQAGLRGPLVGSIIGAGLMIFACGVASWLLIVELSFFRSGMFDQLAAWIGSVLVVIVAFMFYPATIMLVAAPFLDRVAVAVEAKHYPDHPAPRRQGLVENLRASGRLLVVTLIVNILLLPFYILTLFIPGLNLVIFYCVNGYLLGREFFEMVAMRHLSPVDAKALRRDRFWTVLLAGMMVTVITTVPILNLTAPVLATAFMLHIFHRLQSEAKI